MKHTEVIVIAKLRIYLETTVFNYYFDEDRDGHDDVRKLFEAIGRGEYEAYTSTYAADELSAAEKRLAEKYVITTLEPISEVLSLAETYMKELAIPSFSISNALHIAAASVYRLNGLVSYDFQNINRSRTEIMTVRINNDVGYGGVVILTAGELLADDSYKLTDPRDIELDEIRRKLSAQYNAMTPEERHEYFRRRSEEIHKEFNIKVYPFKPVRPRRREEMFVRDV